MRIVGVRAFYTPHGGGVKTYVDRKPRAARKSGARVIVVAPGERNEMVETGDGGTIVPLASPRFPLDRRYRYFADEAALHAISNMVDHFRRLFDAYRDRGMFVPSFADAA
jgi:alpha-1,6-mannosyltransferase